MPVVETLTVVSMGLVVVVGGIRVFEGALEVGFLVAFLIFVQRFFEPIRTLTLQYTMFPAGNGFRRAHLRAPGHQAGDE